MFTYLHPSRSVALRLPEGEREKFLKKYQTTLFEAYGVVQMEYVRVPDNLLRITNELLRYFDISYQYVATLKPKTLKKSLVWELWVTASVTRSFDEESPKLLAGGIKRSLLIFATVI
jgi:hypothetical protein